MQLRFLCCKNLLHVLFLHHIVYEVMKTLLLLSIFYYFWSHLARYFDHWTGFCFASNCFSYCCCWFYAVNSHWSLEWQFFYDRCAEWLHTFFIQNYHGFHDKARTTASHFEGWPSETNGTFDILLKAERLGILGFLQDCYYSKRD